MSAMFELGDHVGSLEQALRVFWKHNVSLSRIESRPAPTDASAIKFYVDFNAHPTDSNVVALLKDLKESVAAHVQLTGSKEVPWFPQNAYQVDKLANNIIGSDTGELEADHPGFSDVEYRARRTKIAEHSLNFQYGQPIPRIQYTPSELECWNKIYTTLMPMHQKHACQEFLDVWPLVEKHCGYSPNNIPQLQDISEFTKERTGFSLRPVAGLLSARDFLYGLAFKIFFCTQYIRHHTKPLYTPEPDICHEILGHSPMFAVQEFADFSHQFGLLSIGASEEQIQRLARCYWYTVEYGVVRQQGKHKAYGAGLLSSFGELEYMAGTKPEFRDWDPYDAAEEDYPITKYQPKYYVAKSFQDATSKLVEFAEDGERPFSVTYDPETETLDVDRNLVFKDVPEQVSRAAPAS